MLVTPGDIQGISHAICELARSRALRQRLGYAARETMSQFSIDSYILKLTEIYGELTGAVHNEFVSDEKRGRLVSPCERRGVAIH